MGLTPQERRFVNWIKKAQPRFYQYFNQVMKTAQKVNNGLGAVATNILPEGDIEAVASGTSFLDKISNLASQYYELEIQKVQMDAALDAAKADAAIVTAPKAPFLTGFRIDPTTGFIGIAALLGLWALTRTVQK